MDVELHNMYSLEGSCTNETERNNVILRLKHSVIGSNKQKQAIVEHGIIPRLVSLFMEPGCSTRLQVNIAYTLGSIAKGSEQNQKVIIDSGVLPVLLSGVFSNESKVVEASLCCLRTIMSHPAAPIDLVYADTSIIPYLIGIVTSRTTSSNKISVASILTSICKTRRQQDCLTSLGCVQALSPLLCSPHSDVQLPALQCMAYLMFNNENVCNIVARHQPIGGITCPIDQIVILMNRDQRIDIQLAASRCITYLYRCGVLESNDERVIYKALPCVVRMTKKEFSAERRILAAETLACLIEVSPDLQRIAAISNNLIPTISSFLWWEPSNETLNSNAFSTQNDMKKAAFRVFASLGANDEDIRKRIIETDSLMDRLVTALENTNPKLQMAAVGCLHSLSRSVQLLRTTFQDHPVWQPLMEMLSIQDPVSVEPLIVASSALCNLLLEFSPSKELILDSGAIELLCTLTHKAEPSLRLNGVWGLMNMAFQADQRIKVQIITMLGSDQVFRLLSDSEINVVMKTLGLLRNLLSHKADIDHIMALYGKQVMQAVVLTLESDQVAEVKEQALCILANIADGHSAKQYIMSNEDVLKKIMSYMNHNHVKLQLSAVVCIINLIWIDDDGSLERQSHLRDAGVYKILQQLLAISTDIEVLEKVKEALQQFS